MNLLFWRRAEKISRTEPGFEETERRTPIAGIFLLLLMFIAGLSFGWRAVDDLARVPHQPIPLSRCSDTYRSVYPQYYRTTFTSPLEDIPERQAFVTGKERPCNFNDLELASAVPELDGKRRAVIETLRQRAGTEDQDYQRSIQRRQELESQYNIRLQERQAGVPGATPQVLAALKQQLTAAEQEEQRLSAAVDQKIAFERERSVELRSIEAELRQAYLPVFEAQNRRLRFYEFKVFLVQALFVIPLCILVFWAYLRLMRKNSPYAIIFSVALAVVGVLTLRIILVWFWGLFLARLIEVLLVWIRSSEILRSLLFYLGMVLSFALFGGAVYYLQKRIFDSRRVAMRRFRAKQCPHCQTNLDLSVNHCPQCGHRVREQCARCGQLRFAELPYCPHCGQPRNEPINS